MEDRDKGTGNYNLARKITRHIRTTMVGGLLLTLPIIITYIVLKWLFDAIDGLLQPAIEGSFGKTIPGLGVVALILILYLVGIAEENYLTRQAIKIGREMLLRVPIISTVYSPAKQLIDAFSGTGDSGFRQVVMIEYPRENAWTIGFLTASTSTDEGFPLSIIYIPTAPTPNSGWIAMIPEQDVRFTDLSVAEAMHLVLSGGIIAPPLISTTQAQ